MSPGPLWTATPPRRSFPTLTTRRRVDAAVIGAGIAGVTAARLLQLEGRTVALLEARRIGDGDTGHTTAHLTEMLDAGYPTLISHFGREGAALAAASQRDAIDRIERFVGDDGIACDFARVPGVRWAETREQAKGIDDELAAMREAGVQAERADGMPLPFPTVAALRVERQARFHPVAYVAGMVERFAAAGGLVFEGTRALRMRDGEPCTVETAQGSVSCRDIVVMTHAPVSSRIFIHSKMAPYRTYAVAARLASPPQDGLYYDSEDPYHYVRLQPTPGGTLVVVGGEDHKAGHERDTRARYAALERWVAARLLGSEIVHRWSGEFWEAADGLAFIGRSPRRGLHPGERSALARPRPLGGGGAAGRGAAGRARRAGRRGPPDRRRRDPRRVRDVHAPRLPCRLERRGGMLGLPVPRQPLRRRRRGALRPRDRAAARGGGAGRQVSERRRTRPEPPGDPFIGRTRPFRRPGP